jgi:hypothetical protein
MANAMGIEELLSRIAQIKSEVKSHPENQGPPVSLR